MSITYMQEEISIQMYAGCNYLAPDDWTPLPELLPACHILILLPTR